MFILFVIYTKIMNIFMLCVVNVLKKQILINWCQDITRSFQSKDASGTIKEIINMVKVNNMSIHLSLKLETGRIIQFKIYVIVMMKYKHACMPDQRLSNKTLLAVL